MSAGEQIESHLAFKKTNTQTETFSKMFTLRGADKELEKRKSIRRPQIMVDEADEPSESISSEALSQSEKAKSYFGNTFTQRTFRESHSGSKQSLLIPKEEPEQKLFPWERH